MTDNNNSTDYLMNAPLKKYFFLFLSANRYLNVLSRHRRADTTLETYASSLRVLIRCIGQIKGEDASLEDLTENDIYDLIGIIPGKESTVKAKINILGGWMEFETGDNLPRRMKMLCTTSSSWDFGSNVRATHLLQSIVVRLAHSSPYSLILILNGAEIIVPSA